MSGECPKGRVWVIGGIEARGPAVEESGRCGLKSTSFDLSPGLGRLLETAGSGLE